MYFIIFFLFGFFSARWLEQTLTRIILKLPINEKIKVNLRHNAKIKDLHLKNKGKVIKLSDIDAMNSLSQPGQFFNDL